jgi:SWI/SNF-related matrix-associated actin-dependent regulator of chromatin subfamily A member 5
MPPKLETKIMCPLSEMQLFWYKRLLLKDSKMLQHVEKEMAAKQKKARNAVAVAAGGMEESDSEEDEDEGPSDGWKKMQSLMMQLRKCCNHPYLFPGAEPEIGVSGACGEDIVTACGKLQTLDVLLRQLHANGHRTCIFSQVSPRRDHHACALTGVPSSHTRTPHPRPPIRCSSPACSTSSTTTASCAATSIAGSTAAPIACSAW